MIIGAATRVVLARVVFRESFEHAKHLKTERVAPEAKAARLTRQNRLDNGIAVTTVEARTDTQNPKPGHRRIGRWPCFRKTIQETAISALKQDAIGKK